MKILITAGAGFIAKNIFEQLNTRYSITSLSRKELDLLDSGKVSDYLEKNKFDVVIHTATYDAAPKHSLKDPAKVLENNLKMFFNISRCRKFFGKMIYFGSGAEFSRDSWVPKMKEDYFDQHVPQDQYGFSKYIMTKYIESVDNIFNLRLFAVFGKYEDWRVRFISNVCCSAVLGQPITINQNKRYDFLYVDDLVKIVDWFINNNPGRHTYNVCTGEIYEFVDLAKEIIEISGKKLDMIVKEDGFGREYSGDNSLLLSEVKDFKLNPIKESIKDLYNWYEANKNTVLKDGLTYVNK